MATRQLCVVKCSTQVEVTYKGVENGQCSQIRSKQCLAGTSSKCRLTFKRNIITVVPLANRNDGGSTVEESTNPTTPSPVLVRPKESNQAMVLGALVRSLQSECKYAKNCRSFMCIAYVGSSHDHKLFAQALLQISLRNFLIERCNHHIYNYKTV